MRGGWSSTNRELPSVSGRQAVPGRLGWLSGTRSDPSLDVPVDEAKPARRSVPLDSPRWEDERLRRLEAVLFVAREALPSRRLAQYANLADATEARTLIGRLNELYDEAGRAFRIEEVAGGYQLLTRAKFATWLRRLGHVPAQVRLSAPALETLAVIAYRQPVPRAEIEAVRGVNSGEILRQLMERDLVRISGRSEELGRPYLYATTKKFLQVFGLVSLEELPRAETLRRSTESAVEDAPRTMPPSSAPRTPPGSNTPDKRTTPKV